MYLQIVNKCFMHFVPFKAEATVFNNKQYLGITMKAIIKEMQTNNKDFIFEGEEIKEEVC